MLEPIENQYLQVGRISRSHGVRGEVVVDSDFDAPSLFDDTELVNLQNARGDLFPVRIESVRFEEKDGRLLFFVKFEHVTDRNGAETLKGCPVFVKRDRAESLVDTEEAPQDYTGFKIVDEQGQPFGTVRSVLDNPAHLILEVETAAQKSLLVPFVDEYVVGVDERKKTVRCHNLDQLEEL